MIKKLKAKDKREILNFCYKNERENLFAIGSFKNYEDPFSEVVYYGYFTDGEIMGLATYYKKHKNFVINALKKEVVRALVDYAVEDKISVEFVANFEKFATPTIQRLKKYGITPKETSSETVYVLSQNEFTDFSKGNEDRATVEDIDEVVALQNEDNGQLITEEDRGKIIPHQEFLIRDGNKIVSKANIHGVSEKYFQIGGVGTLKEFRGRGYAKQIVSYLCKNYFDEGKKYGLLFTANDNASAIAVYEKIGFKPVEEFTIARY
ncbi:GNAT family N-acetyltransferase [Candidatus Peregrinibacteria bacterium]|jgi:predicted GNAT family acetyltransferase|nr:GNAT family N-acetyltransferase [Candidatus Peregrinibacteria bacterium]MBT7736315.1 GNAT family N-acetyltransferase [Candidatus Peregrinibacteria bacterium]